MSLEGRRTRNVLNSKQESSSKVLGRKFPLQQQQDTKSVLRKLAGDLAKLSLYLNEFSIMFEKS